MSGILFFIFASCHPLKSNNLDTLWDYFGENNIDNNGFMDFWRKFA